ncbi:sugar transferase [Brachybacterium kimchii]|uniref:Exopolysaccharide biosynthesis polyprenyl glycosylphosphotransferase n=1 Tax=Brachybacterium kimchii TaxID=2942909 RepID=A0ABY4N1Q5_9MICO|nr:exopolysaccharide biosynthesis polyprenyl glycosylphosphotransferase [Brachybacterium kimchii]UQN28468.1 exopolysaccharide biosynthesis polyprenyl glycosylphosphotransferase [Brachybacterium kimchii]
MSTQVAEVRGNRAHAASETAQSPVDVEERASSLLLLPDTGFAEPGTEIAASASARSAESLVVPLRPELAPAAPHADRSPARLGAHGRRVALTVVLSLAVAVITVGASAVMTAAPLAGAAPLAVLALAWAVMMSAQSSRPLDSARTLAARPLLLVLGGALLLALARPFLGEIVPSGPALLVLTLALGAGGAVIVALGRLLHPVRSVLVSTEPVDAMASGFLEEEAAVVVGDGSVPMDEQVQDVLDRVEETGSEVVEVRGAAPAQLLTHLSWELRGRGIPLKLSFMAPGARRSRVRVVSGAHGASVVIRPPRQPVPVRMAKRAFDILGSALLLAALSPLLIAVSFAVRLDDHGPIFYRQERVGKDGRPFHMFKFRSMAVDADAKLAELLREQQTDDKPLFKIQNDPRLTRIGGFLRRYSIDEIPQLLNVLGGSMSLVGPRPQRDGEVALYTGSAFHRLGVVPGMTGLWQVSGRSALSWEQAQALDVRYAHNWSLGMDLWIMLRTVKAVVGKDGAY